MLVGAGLALDQIDVLRKIEKAEKIKMLDEFLKMSYHLIEEAGTYLFYGDDLEKNYNNTSNFQLNYFQKYRKWR